jgi:CDP-glycerol glycerophosphotransferase
MCNLLVSIIVPCYKVEQYLQECVNGLISQTYRNIEIILVDDGSPDKCGELCDEYLAGIIESL